MLEIMTHCGQHHSFMIHLISHERYTLDTTCARTVTMLELFAKFEKILFVRFPVDYIVNLTYYSSI